MEVFFLARVPVACFDQTLQGVYERLRILPTSAITQPSHGFHLVMTKYFLPFRERNRCSQFCPGAWMFLTNKHSPPRQPHGEKWNPTAT